MKWIPMFEGFRGNFVAFSWYGDEDSSVTPFYTAFDDNVQNAMYTSGTLQRYVTEVLHGQWGLSANDIDIIAHSLGNLVVWDALRLHANMGSPVDGVWQNAPLLRNFISVEAAIWSEAFEPEGPVNYLAVDGDTPISYTVTQLEGMSWHHWFNPSDVNVRSAVAGKITHSYHDRDFALYTAMRENDKEQRGDAGLFDQKWHFYRDRIPYTRRGPENMWNIPALLQHGHRQSDAYGRTDLSLPVGYVTNPLAHNQVSAGLFGWDNPNGYTSTTNALYDDTGHSDFICEPYSDTAMWWFLVMGSDPDGIWIGKQA